MSVTWTAPPKACSSLVRVGRWTALIAGILYGRRRWNQLAEPTRLWDLDQRNKRFVRDDIVMSARWLASVEELNTLAEVIGVPYRVKHTREDMKANGFVVDRSKYFKGIEDPWKGNMVEAYKAAGITYIDMFPEEHENLHKK
uniref:ATP synthase F(0) complex subunit e, mitochondrial n=1 Tax=Pinctada fucata TaxID=50426 RepID=A0A194AN67_PINFU